MAEYNVGDNVIFDLFGENTNGTITEVNQNEYIIQYDIGGELTETSIEKDKVKSKFGRIDGDDDNNNNNDDNNDENYDVDVESVVGDGVVVNEPEKVPDDSMLTTLSNNVNSLGLVDSNNENSDLILAYILVNKDESGNKNIEWTSEKFIIKNDTFSDSIESKNWNKYTPTEQKPAKSSSMFSMFGKKTGGNKHLKTIRNKNSNYRKTEKAVANKRKLSKNKRHPLNKYRKTYRK
jgi:hypothetical protein